MFTKENFIARLLDGRHPRAVKTPPATRVLSSGDADLVRDFAMPIPIMVICDTLGLPMDRIDELSRGADSMVAHVGSGGRANKSFSMPRTSCSCSASRRKPSTSAGSVPARI